jgi:hypothetical protein
VLKASGPDASAIEVNPSLKMMHPTPRNAITELIYVHLPGRSFLYSAPISNVVSKGESVVIIDTSETLV